MRKVALLAILVVLVSLPVLAHDGVLTDPGFTQFFTPIEVIHNEVEFDINDDPIYPDEYKGWASITVTNTMNQPWGDFHFQITSWSAVPSVIFDDPFGNFMYNSTGMQAYAGATYQITTPQQLDFYFYGNPLQPGQTATFKVYTDNTTDQNAWFGISMWPTPVPEPATIAILGLGGAAILMKKRRK